jgi:membrane associated rhomboid family serine protease
MTPTPVGMRCPECARQRTKVRTARTLGGDPTATYVLIAINVFVALGVALSGAGLGQNVLATEIGQRGALFGPAVADGDVWRLLTAGFLHAGPIHLLFNMYSLYILGTLLEPAIGRARFLIVYFVALLCGSFGALLVSPNTPTVGASGAVFGIMGAAIVVLRHRGIDPMASGLPFWLGLNLVLTFTYSGQLSVGGHIGGVIGGALAAFLLYEVPDRVRLPRLGGDALAALLGVAAVVGSIAVA